MDEMKAAISNDAAIDKVPHFSPFDRQLLAINF